MASRVELFTVTVPAGTLQSAPLETATPFDIGVVERIQVLVPPGHVGRTGFQLRHGGDGVFPREATKFIVADNERLDIDVQDGPDAGDWAFRAYNEGAFPHSWYVRFFVAEVSPRPLLAPPAMVVVQANQPANEAEDASFEPA